MPIILCENCAKKYVEEDDVLCDSCSDEMEKSIEEDLEAQRFAERAERDQQKVYEAGRL